MCILEEILFWEESRIGRNPFSEGFPFWEKIPFQEEFHFRRNPISGGIPFWEESRFGRNPVLIGIPFWEESHLGGILFWEESRLGRSSMGKVQFDCSSGWEGSRLGGVPWEKSYERSPVRVESKWNHTKNPALDP